MWGERRKMMFTMINWAPCFVAAAALALRVHMMYRPKH
jgi:hypothetical protein